MVGQFRGDGEERGIQAAKPVNEVVMVTGGSTLSHFFYIRSSKVLCQLIGGVCCHGFELKSERAWVA
jgi:hypothetical protein